MSSLNLIPLKSLSDQLTFFSESDKFRCSIDRDGNFRDNNDVYELALVEDDDLPDLCRFIVGTFGADAIRISTQDFSTLEKLFLTPGVELLNGYSTLVAFTEVFSGTQQRLKGRLARGGGDIEAPHLDGTTMSRKEMIEQIEKESIILALAKRNDGGKLDIIASIELRLQPCDAKIPFSLPWLDKIERSLASTIGLGGSEGEDLQPYLSNLCVDEKFRGRKIGRALVRCVENIAKETWGYRRIYLHVDEDNTAALKLYESEGYHDVGHRWSPFWAGSAADIGYYVKSLQTTNGKK